MASSSSSPPSSSGNHGRVEGPDDVIHFQTDCHHYGTVQPVRATGGPREGHWICKIHGPKVTGSSGVKTVYCPPILEAARHAIARYLQIPPSSVRITLAGSTPTSGGSGVGSNTNRSFSSGHDPSAAVPATMVSPSPVKKSARQSPARRMTRSAGSPPLAPSSSSQPRYDLTYLMARATPSGKDVWEPSPNNAARCRTCGNKIEKGGQRIGKWTIDKRLRRSYHVYYHAQCASEEVRARLRLRDTRDVDRERTALLNSREDLRERLRQLRLAFARKLQVEPYRIFKDTTLDDITVKLPVTKSELVKCNGIKEKRCQSFGSAILAITKLYKKQNSLGNDAKPPSSSSSGSRNDGNRGSNNASGRFEHDISTTMSASIGEEDVDDDIIEVGTTLSCDDIVRQKFEHAAANGYIIEV